MATHTHRVGEGQAAGATVRSESATAPPQHSQHAAPVSLPQVGVERWQGPPHADRKQAKALAAHAVLERLLQREHEQEREQK